MKFWYQNTLSLAAAYGIINANVSDSFMPVPHRFAADIGHNAALMSRSTILYSGGLTVKRFCTFLLGALLSLWMAVPGVAAAPQRIGSLHPQFADHLFLVTLDGEALPPEELTNLTVYAGSELRVYLQGQEDARLFYDQNGAPLLAADISLSRLRAARIAVYHNADGSSVPVVESVELLYGVKTAQLPSASPCVSIRFASEFASVEAVPFAVTVGLSMAGIPQEGTEFTVSGTMEIKEQIVTASEPAVDISDGSVAVAGEDIGTVRVTVGQGVTIDARFTEGEKYYGVAHLELDSSAANTPSLATGVVRVYSLDTINLAGPHSRVEIDSDVTLHVYDEDGAYLGTTRDRLPCTGMYYLSNRKMAHFVP